MTNAPDPVDCTSMDEVRAAVDILDAELWELLGRRFGYMRQAAWLKPNRAAVRDEGRKAEVVANAVLHARRHGIPDELAAALWDTLVEQSIFYETVEYDRIDSEGMDEG